MACAVKYQLTLVIISMVLLSLLQTAFAEIRKDDKLYMNYLASSPNSHERDNASFPSHHWNEDKDRQQKTRQKRLLYFSDQRRLTFPPGTGLFITPTFSLPFIRNMPSGYATGMTISLPFKLNFDGLGWGSVAHPYGIIPGLSETIRKKKDLNVASFASTEYMYGIFEEILTNMGYPGKLCLQRAVCEMREGPLSDSYGWLKNILEWVLTPSVNSNTRKNLEAYLEAEKMGRTLDCTRYHKCSKSIFASSAEYNERMRDHQRKSGSCDEEELTNEIMDERPSKNNKTLHSKKHNRCKTNQKITVESLAYETKMKKRMDKIQAIAMLQSFNQVIR